MNTDRHTEDQVHAWLQEGIDTIPDHVLRDVIEQADTTTQARRRTLGRWFDRGGGVRCRTNEHDHPSDSSRRNRLMFSATGLVAAFAVLALTVNVVNTTDTSPPGAATGTEYSVAADGSGDFSTIAEAVEAAADGDIILVRPGTYTEAIRIDKDITLMGDGPREDIVLDSAAGPLIDLDGSNATLAGFTFDSPTTFVNVSGGAPTLEDLWFRGVGVPYEGGAGVTPSLVITGASTAIVRDNLFTDGGALQVYGDASPLIVSNEFRDGPHIALWRPGDATIVRGNSVVDNLHVAMEIRGRPLIVGNVLDGSGSVAVGIGFGEGSGVAPLLRDNVITRAPIGIEIATNAAPTLEGNRIDVEGSAINLAGPSEAVFTGNEICGGEAIVTNPRDAAVPSLDDNEICQVPAAE